MRSKSGREPRPRVRDLFGEVPVSQPDIEAWLRAVPRMDPQSPRAAQYIRAYNVPDKIRHAKLAGRFDQVVSHRPC